MVLGASLKVISPTGQYDPTKLINWGINRWAFKPEFGYSQRFGKKWILDGYAGAVLLHHEPEILFDSHTSASNQKPDRFLRRSPELRREDITVGSRPFGSRSTAISGSGEQPVWAAYRTPLPGRRVPALESQQPFR